MSHSISIIEHKQVFLQACGLAHMLVYMCLSGGCTVAKRLIGSGNCFEWWVWSVEGWVY